MDPYGEFLSLMNRLLPIYQEAKGIVLLAEQIGSNGKFPLESLTEMREALDHIMCALERPDSSAVEIESARFHLCRTAVRAYTIFISHAMVSIRDDLTLFSTKTLCQVIPEYYQGIKPELLLIKKQAIELRQLFENPFHLTEDPVIAFREMSIISARLDEIQVQIQTKIPALMEYQERSSHEDRTKQVSSLLLRLLVGVLGAIAGGLGVYALTA